MLFNKKQAQNSSYNFLNVALFGYSWINVIKLLVQL